MKKITYEGRLSSVFIPRLGIKAKRGEEIEVTDATAERATAMYPDMFTSGSVTKKKAKVVGGEK